MLMWLLACMLVLPFGYVLIFGAPYLPTRKKQANQALDLLELKEGDVFVDLGSGDGAVLIEAARRGVVCYGYELNPLVFFASKLRTLKYRNQIKIYCRDYWQTPLPENTKGVFVFLLDPFMERLDNKLSSEMSDGGRLVSYTFKIPNKKAIKSKNAMYLYKY